VKGVVRVYRCVLASSDASSLAQREGKCAFSVQKHERAPARASASASASVVLSAVVSASACRSSGLRSPSGTAGVCASSSCAYSTERVRTCNRM